MNNKKTFIDPLIENNPIIYSPPILKLFAFFNSLMSIIGFS